LWGVVGGQLLRSDDGGATWAPVPGSAPPMAALHGDPADRDAAVAVTSVGLARTSDGGATWQPLSGVRAHAFALHPTRVAYAGGEGAWRSTDGGATWSPVAAPGGAAVGHLAIDPGDAQVVYAATRDAAVWRSADGGATWTRLMAPSR
ncbi:MAG TPA: hypothetical protein VNX21_05395, partial [Candidatus Thermoplasmatota archaeon]|nr:hypothetical protein [Candidatus Thermoplasmatota archaeon]